jgi:hypothetical protein
MDNEGSNIEPIATRSTDLKQDFDASFNVFGTFMEADSSNIDQAPNNGLGSKLWLLFMLRTQYLFLFKTFARLKSLFHWAYPLNNSVKRKNGVVLIRSPFKMNIFILLVPFFTRI